jgi:hypothetical protein
MKTYAVVLILEDLEEADRHPMYWNWSEILDIPTSVFVSGAVQIAAQPDEKQITVLEEATDLFISTLMEGCKDGDV